jgi:hypothetical protein
MLTGCLNGAIYTNVTVPLDVNFDATPVVSDDDSGNIKTLRVYYVQADWGDASIGAIAKDHGFKEVHYADLRTLSVLGVWTQRFVTIYGVRQ